RPLRCPPFPYTTLFRSERDEKGLELLGAWAVSEQLQRARALAAGGEVDEQFDGVFCRSPDDVGVCEIDARCIASFIELAEGRGEDRKSTRLNSSHVKIS